MKPPLPNLIVLSMVACCLIYLLLRIAAAVYNYWPRIFRHRRNPYHLLSPRSREG